MTSTLSVSGGGLYYIDQARPTSLHRVAIDGNGTRFVLVLDRGLSRPRAVAFGSGLGFIADSGTQQLLGFTMGEQQPTPVVFLDEGPAGVHDPRGLAMRSDVTARIPTLFEPQESAASTRHGWLHATTAATALTLVSSAALLRVASGSEDL